jgi:putative heme degradation protein
MIIHANVKSKAMKKGAVTKMDLRDCCGALHLDSENVADLKLLTAMYGHCFGALERNSKGSIKVFDAEGKEVVHYFYEVK